MVRFSQTLQILFSLILVFFVLIQSKGKGFSNAFGSSSGMYSTRRGLEKAVFIMTIVLAILLVLNSMFLIFLNK